MPIAQERVLAEQAVTLAPPAEGISRQRFLGRLGASIAGVAVGSELLSTALGGRSPFLAALPAFAGGGASVVAPLPIPGGDNNTHHFLPGRGKEVSTINDFNGFVGIAQLTGTGKGSDGSALNFSCDNRFLLGNYIGEDGQLHQGAFGVF
jgi:hypothetical protein